MNTYLPNERWEEGHCRVWLYACAVSGNVQWIVYMPALIHSVGYRLRPLETFLDVQEVRQNRGCLRNALFEASAYNFAPQVQLDWVFGG
jgi:hypothetical protein